jgi:hypothetical protein
MKTATRYSPEQWAEARRLRGEGMTYRAIADRLGFAHPSTIAGRARAEGWADACAGAAESEADPRPKASPRPKPGPRSRAVSPDAAEDRRRFARRLYRIVDVRIKKMELSMQKQLQALEQDPGTGAASAGTREECESFAALIEQINQVTEMASEPASAADGRRKSADINPELTALSGDIDAGALAAASEKDQLRREIADQLEKLLPPA